MAEDNKVVKVVEDNLRQLAQETTEMLMEKITIISKAVEKQLITTGAESVSVTAAPSYGDLKNAISVIKYSKNQSELTSAILSQALNFTSRAAIFVCKPNQIQGWEVIGIDQQNKSAIQDFKKVTIPLEEPSLFKDVINSQTTILKPFEKNNISNYLMIQMGGLKPQQTFLAPLILKDKVIAVLFTDCLEEDSDRFAPDALSVIAEYASLVMEILSVGRMLRKHEPDAADEAAPETTIAEEDLAAEITPKDGETAPAKTQVAEKDPLADMDPQARDLHEKAKRTARVIVSDIVLYNKAKIEEGIANGNLKELLKEDIDRGKELYMAKIPSEVADTSDYFIQALIQTVAKGDAALLGL